MDWRKIRQWKISQEYSCRTFKYSLASCLCSSNICFDSSLFGSGGAGLKCGSSIRCTESKLSSSIPASTPVFIWSLLPSKFSLDGFVEFLNVVGFAVLSTLPIRVRALPEDDAMALDLASVVVTLSLFWLLAVI